MWLYSQALLRSRYQHPLCWQPGVYDRSEDGLFKTHLSVVGNLCTGSELDHDARLCMQGYDTDDDVSMGRVSDFSVEPSQESNSGALFTPQFYSHVARLFAFM